MQEKSIQIFLLFQHKRIIDYDTFHISISPILTNSQKHFSVAAMSDAEL